MKLTSSLQVRQLIAKLHPPLPQSPRETQRLASLLQSSFKRRLDEIYPAPQTDNSREVPSISPQPAKSASAEATHTHLQAVLRHPLIDRRSTVNNQPGLDRLLSFWDHALVENKIDIAFIGQLVKSNTRLIIRDREFPAKLGSRIIDWFASSSNGVKEKLLTDKYTIYTLIPFLYEGGHEEVVWDWLRLLYGGDLRNDNPTSRFDIKSPGWLSCEDEFVACMIRESLKRNDLNTAAKEYVEACAYRIKSGRASFHRDTQTLIPAMFASWKHLSRSILRKRHSHAISSPLYDKLMSYAVPIDVLAWIDPAFLHLYVPLHPTSDPLVSRLRDPQWVSLFNSWKYRISGNFQKDLVLSILDAAQLALDTGNTSSSHQILRFVEQHFAAHVSPQNEGDLARKINNARTEVHFGQNPDLLFQMVSS